MRGLLDASICRDLFALSYHSFIWAGNCHAKCLLQVAALIFFLFFFSLFAFLQTAQLRLLYSVKPSLGAK